MIENQKMELDICSPVKSLLSTQTIPIRFRCKWSDLDLEQFIEIEKWEDAGLTSNISVMWADTAFIVRPSWKLWTSRRRVNAVNVSLARLQLAAWCSNKCDLDPYLTRWSSVMAGLWCFTYQTLSNSEPGPATISWRSLCDSYPGTRRGSAQAFLTSLWFMWNNGICQLTCQLHPRGQ